MAITANRTVKTETACYEGKRTDADIIALHVRIDMLETVLNEARNEWRATMSHLAGVMEKQDALNRALADRVVEAERLASERFAANVNAHAHINAAIRDVEEIAVRLRGNLNAHLLNPNIHRPTD